MIKLEALRVFVTVANAGNIKDAAATLCRTPSAVSMALKQLEGDVGGALFETDYKDNLTALGQFVFDTASAQIHSYDQAIGNIHAFANNKIGRLALASVPSVASNLVPEILARFIEKRPGIKIQLYDLDTQNVRRFVETGQAQIGISGKPHNSRMVNFEPLFRDRFKLVCSKSNALVERGGPVRWEDLEHQTLIGNGASDTLGSPYIDKLSKEASMTIPNVTSLIAITKAGLGVTLLPALSTTHLPKGVTSLDLEDTSIERIVGLVTSKRSSLDTITRAFRDEIFEMMPMLALDLDVTAVGR